jgi:probable addiction module antidote protein
MMETKNTPYAVAEFLGTPGEMAAWLEACIHESEGDAAFIAKELGDITCEKGMSQIAREPRLSRDSLYKAFSVDRNSRFNTTLKVISHFSIEPQIELLRNGNRNS